MSRGRVTIPVEVRRRLGLRPGAIVSFEIRGRAVFVRKGDLERHPVDRVYGLLKHGKFVDALLDEMRGRRR